MFDNQTSLLESSDQMANGTKCFRVQVNVIIFCQYAQIGIRPLDSRLKATSTKNPVDGSIETISRLRNSM